MLSSDPMYICTHTNTQRHTDKQTDTHTRTHTHKLMYTNTFICYTHTHTYTNSVNIPNRLRLKPVVVHDYNQHMLGVDKLDQFASYYSFLHKSVK